jgi:hypothetical protein
MPPQGLAHAGHCCFTAVCTRYQDMPMAPQRGKVRQPIHAIRLFARKQAKKTILMTGPGFRPDAIK